MEEENKKDELSIQEVWDVLKFAGNLAGSPYPGIYTPDLLAARLKDTSFTPRDMTEQELTDALKNPKESEALLRSIVEYVELVSAPFRKILNYMASMLALDLTYTVTNVKDSGEYKKKPFKDDQNVVYDWLDRFEHKYHFRNAIKQLLRNEVYVCSVRDEGEKIVLQELPLQYLKITSKWDYGYLVAMDFSYFMRPGIDLNLFPTFFKKKYGELFAGNKSMPTYNPSLPPEMRGNSQFAYWVDLPPSVAFVFKLDPSMATAVPYFASLVGEFRQQPEIRALQRNLNMAAASKMLIGAVPMLKDTKTKVSDMIAISPDTLGKFLALVRSALSESIKVASAPLEDMQAVSFETDNEMYDKYLRTAVSSSGVNSALIYSGTLKANAIESQLSFQTDSLLMEDLYPQFNNFMNYFVNKNTKKYKYSFEFEGNSYYLDRQQRFDYAISLANIGIVLPQKIAAARGMKPQTLYRMMEETAANDWVSKLTPIVSSFQQPANANVKENGRPKKSDSELSEEGEETRSQGANISRGGKNT